ncbi:hypothetical protein FOZ61_007380 [Perkinsus olseni]|uniref:Uncharacterized protein n=1 Tax=Perkinsus olseni TaxID=32597 RepID=A0A7J6L9B4_PEROL|nr:hypothetical protein FOZ61_007380 [Perkinsus olseni]
MLSPISAAAAAAEDKHVLYISVDMDGVLCNLDAALGREMHDRYSNFISSVGPSTLFLGEEEMGRRSFRYGPSNGS